MAGTLLAKVWSCDTKHICSILVRDHGLTPEDRKRNTWGSSVKSSFNPCEPTLYPSSLPERFPLSIDARQDGAQLLMGCISFLAFATGYSSVQKFPSPKMPLHTPLLVYHGVNVPGSERSSVP